MQLELRLPGESRSLARALARKTAYSCWARDYLTVFYDTRTGRDLPDFITAFLACKYHVWNIMPPSAMAAFTSFDRWGFPDVR